MQYEDLYQDNDGLNGGLKKLNLKKALKKVSLKNVVKVAKVAIPIATSFIPAIGGTVSKITGKLLTNKAGGANLIGRVANVATKVSKTKAGALVTSNIKQAITNKPAPVEPVNQLVPASFATDTTFQTQQSTVSNAVEAVEPVGELTPVKEVFSTAKSALLPIVEEKKSNTMLWVIGGIIVAGGLYVATKKD